MQDSAHLRTLLAKHNLTLRVSAKGRGAWYVPAARRVVMQPGCPHLYVTCLHEIGHSVVGVGDERGAWAWAEQNACRPFTPPERYHMRRCLASYGL